jgi:hypothetical protein
MLSSSIAPFGAYAALGNRLDMQAFIYRRYIYDMI